MSTYAQAKRERIPAAPPPGASDLRGFLRRTKLTVNAFARAFGLDRIQLGRVMNGRITRVSVDLADDIERATGGEVPCRRWRREKSKVNCHVGRFPEVTPQAS